MADRRKKLFTIGEVLEVVGIDRARKIAGVKAPVAHYMWKNRRKFPPETYAAFTAILTQNGCSAPASLWGQRDLVS